MRKIAILLAIFFALSCSRNEEQIYDNELILKGYADVESRTAFGEPDENKIPYLWSAGDYIWLGGVKSNPIAEDCLSAQFKWQNTPSTIDAYHLFYNMTAESNKAKVLAEQSADGNLGNDGDFGYAVADEFGVFVLSHKTSYIWFDTTSEEDLPKLTKITVTAAEGLALAGQQVFDYQNNQWSGVVTNGTNSVVLDFGEGVELQSENEGVFATMVTLPAAIGGTELTVIYTFADGSTFTEVKNPRKDLVAGGTQRIKTAIEAGSLVKEPVLNYDLRVLDFEGEYWDGLVDNLPFLGDILYPGDWEDHFSWSDSGNTELAFTAIDQGMGYSLYSGGHAISNYTKPGYAPEDLKPYIEEYYGAYDEYLHGWQYLQLLTPIGARSGDNFAVHFGYYDYAAEYNMLSNLISLKFEDEEPRVIDHMYITNTNYALNQLIYGVTRADVPGDAFGGNYKGPGENSWFKVVAYGYASLEDDPVERGEGDDRDFNPEDYVDGERVTKAEFYLLKGKADGYDVVLDWQKWDLSVLGPVVKVKFNVVGSEDMGGEYGLTIPAYFAYDDIAVRFEK